MGTAEASFPKTVDEISAAWLTTTLRTAGVLGESTSVETFESAPVAMQGTASLVTRLTPRYSQTEGAGPPSIVAKLASPVASVRTAVNDTGAAFREVRLYRHMMGASVAGVVPACYAAEYERETGTFIVLMEDLSEWAAGDLLEPPPGHAASVLRAMAGLHAQYWADPELEEARWLSNSNARRAEYISVMLKVNLPRCEDLFPGAVGPHTAAIARLAIEDPRTFQLLGNGPQTIVHGDLHIQNAMFQRDDVRVIDWQSCFRAFAMVDVSRLLISSLTTADRRSLTGELLNAYCDAIAAAGVRDYEMEQAQDDFAVGFIHSVMVYLIALPIVDLSEYRAREMASGVSLIDATLVRLEAALDDHDTLGMVRQRLASL